MSGVNNIFGSLSGSSAGINLGDYASIKNGSYKKLLKAYYKEQDNKTSKVDSKDAKTEKKQNEQMSSTASDLNTAARKLMDSKLLAEKTDEQGNKTIDRDNLVKNMKSFVESYNNTLDEAVKSDNNSVLRSAVWTTNMMKKNSGILEDAGIKIGEDNKLTLDEDKLRKADTSVLNTLTQGHSSLIGRVAQKASSIATSASNAAGSYTRSASPNTAVSQLLSSKFDQEV